MLRPFRKIYEIHWTERAIHAPLAELSNNSEASKIYENVKKNIVAFCPPPPTPTYMHHCVKFVFFSKKTWHLCKILMWLMQLTNRKISRLQEVIYEYLFLETSAGNTNTFNWQWIETQAWVSVLLNLIYVPCFCSNVD